MTRSPAKALAHLRDQVANRLDQRRYRRSRWYSADRRSGDAGVFIVGCGRSGTTLLREMLCRHSAFGGGPETLFFVKTLDLSDLSVLCGLPRGELEALRARCGSLVDFAEAFYRAQAAREGKRRWVDKTPMHVRALPRILRCFPEARAIHLIRDGRDVACSLRHHPRERVRRGRIVPNRVERPIEACAGRWVRDVTAGLAYAGHPRLLTLRYEALVDAAETELRRVCDFLAEPFESGMLSPAASGSGRAGVLINNANATEGVSRSRQGRWTRDLSASELATVERIAGELLIALGYAADASWAQRS